MTTPPDRGLDRAGPAPAAGRPLQRSVGRRRPEPLNANEAWKQEDGGLNVRERIEQVYAKEGFASIPPQDLSGRFRWWGLYTQRKPGIDGGRTAQLDDTELSDEYFMLRVRLDGGALTLAQLRVLADLSHEFARGTADISDRQNIQYHWIRVEDVPEIWRRLEAVGLQTTEACGDTPRVILGSPLAGIAADEILDPTPDDRRDHAAASSATPSSPTCPASSSRRSPGTRASTSCTRSTTSRSSGSCTPSSAPATTSGSVAGCPPPRASPSGSASSSPPTRPPTCGSASSRSSATTATAGCAPRPA